MNSGVDAQTLSLPKGGGAVKGLGTTFETDLNTGTGSFSIPIDTPAGPNGLRPTINLRYHSAGGNSTLGMGWTFGAMAIGRKTEGRIPDYGPDDNEYTLIGVEDLLPVGNNLYRPRVDTMHYKIERKDNSWEVTDTRGTIHRLGLTTRARVETTSGPAVKTALWLLEEVLDTRGNRIRFFYKQADAQRYLERIEWGTYALHFLYTQRPDPLTDGRFGFLLHTTYRCSSIELHVTTESPSRIRSWDLEYVEAPGSGLSLLHKVILRGHGRDNSTLEAPPLTMEYTGLQPRQLERFTAEASGAAPGPFAGNHMELVDWNGNSLPDILEITGGRTRIWPNKGRLCWGVPRTMDRLPASLALHEPGVAFADMEGNGTADLIMLDRQLTGYYPHRPGGGFDPPVFWKQGPSHRITDRNTRLVDLDGDGIVDMLVTGEHFFTLYFRDGEKGWQPLPRTIPRTQAPPVSFGDNRIFLGDMNGDGLQDIVRVDGAGVAYWPYLGNGHWADKVVMANPPDLPRNFDPDRLFLVDIDGDGCADLVYVEYGSVYYWLNRGGSTLGEGVKIPYTPPAEKNQFRVADMKGTGTAGIIWSAMGPGSRSIGSWYLDFTGGVKPYLLSKINNGLGLINTIRYRPSTEFALDDEAAGNPWKTFYPFPVQCVAEIEHRDQITGKTSVTRHTYHNGHYDPVTRTFLGFGNVDTLVPGDDAVPSLLTRNTYHLGLDPDEPDRRPGDEERLRLGALRRRLLCTEVYSPDGSADADKPYHITRHEYTARLEPALDGAFVAVPWETKTLEEQWERGPHPFAFREITYHDIDSYGNIQKQQLRIWRQGEPEPDKEIVTEITFARNLQAHIVSLPARITQKDGSGERVSDTITYYDGPPHQGLPAGNVDKGHTKRVETLVLPDNLVTAVYGTDQPVWTDLGYHRLQGESGWWVTRESHELDSQGGQIIMVTKGPRQFGTRMVLDSTGQYPLEVTDAAGNIRTGVPDERALQMASFIEPNGNEVSDTFDPLGRVISVIKPGDTPGLPTTQYHYQTNTLPISLTTKNRQEHGGAATLDDYQYFNGGGMLIQNIVRGEGDLNREFIVQEAREYSVRGQVSKRYLPYYIHTPHYAAPPPGSPSLSLHYDALGRLVKEEKVSGSVVTQVFKPGTVEMFDENDNASPAPTPRIHRLDALQRIVTVEHHLSSGFAAYEYHYNSLDHLVRVSGPEGGITEFSYDLLGHIISEQTPDTGKIIFVVDAAGNQVRRTMASGKSVTMDYDELDRLVTVQEQGSPDPEITYTYLDSGDPEPADGWHNRKSRPYQVRDRVGTIIYTYDALGRVKETSRIVNELGGRELKTTFAYDALNRQTRITLPAHTPGTGRRVVEYSYNNRGLLDSSPGYVRETTYDVRGQMTSLVYQNNVETRITYDPATSRPHQVIVEGPGNTILRDQTFHFDPVGNLLKIDSPMAMEAVQCTYDDLYRLRTADYGSGEHFGYTYSLNGNLTKVDGVGTFTYGGLPGSGAVTQANGASYGYDPDGHLSTASYGSLTFNGLDNLVRVNLTDGRTMECVYDFQGQRAVKRMSDGGLTITADPHLDIIDGDPVLWITFGGKRIFAFVSQGGVFLHSDANGTPSLYTRIDGTEARRLALGPYGTLRHDSAAQALSAAFSFLGKVLDGETGLVCMGRRYYDPRLGRFISPDRIVPGIYAPGAWNRYIYGHNNPFRYIDPTGRKDWDWKDILTIIAVAIVVVALVVAGIFTMGSTWALAAGITVNVGGLLIGTAVGVAAGATLGGIAAAQAGGDIWAGVLFGGAIGGVAAFGGGILGSLAGGAIGIAVPNQLGMYLAGGIGGAVQGAIIGAGTGAAVGFAGGKGSAESVWTHIWKGAAMGAITGAALGLLSAYIMTTPNATLRVAGVDKLNPTTLNGAGVSDHISYLDTYASLGAGVANTAATGSGTAGAGAFIGVGSGPGLALLNIPIDWVPQFLFQYGGFVAITNTVIALDKFTGFDFDDILIMGLEMAPYFIGLFFSMADAGNWEWYNKMKEGLHDAFSMPE